MIPLHLHIVGFLSYHDPVELDFTTFDLACISGQNGAGKSSLLDAITWSLFGESRAKDKDALINLQSKAAEVALTFSYENNIYRVQRTLPRGKTTILEFQIKKGDEWKPLTERTTRETQARIEQTLRLDYETFVNAAFFLQGKADQFTQQNASKRKDVLSNILGLEIWETYKARTVEKRRGLENEVIGIDRSIADIDSELDEEEPRKRRLKELEDELKRQNAMRKAQEIALENLRKIAASFDQQLVAEKSRLEEEKRGLVEQEKVVSNQRLAVGELTSRIESAKKSLAEAEEKLEQRSELEVNRNSAREEYATLKAENELLKTQMDELKERMDQLESAEGATCPLCGQALSEEHRQSTLKQLQAEGKEKGDRFRTNKTSIDELAKEIADYESQNTKFANAERERLTYSNSITQWNERIEATNASIKNWETVGAKRLKEVEKMLASKKYSMEEEKPSVNLDEAERALRDLQEQENRLNQEVGAARQKVSVLDELRKRKADLMSAREALALQIAHHKTLERAFGKDGVPALLIEQALPQIESKANELLDRLSDGQMSIRFVTQAEYKDKKRDDLKETLDIQISDAAGMRDYEMYSGGEAFRVNFAIRLALSEVLAQRKGARLQTLVIDEGFGSQDEQGRQRLIEAINLVRNDFAKILVITHLDELKDAFPTRIVVEKTDHGSTVQVS
jgi:exonuclease SbcC